VTERAPHEVDPADEARHQPTDEELFNESYYMDFVTEDGTLGGYVRLGLYPNMKVAWWTTMIVGPDRPVVASVAYDLPVPADPSLVVSAAPHELALEVLDPLKALRVVSHTPGTVHETAGAVYRDDPGVPCDVELDLTWQTDGSPYHYELTTRYEIPCLVEGSVTIDGTRHDVRGVGQRDHSWGVRDWWAFGWCWSSVRLDDGTRVHFSDIRIPGVKVAFGYRQQAGRVETISAIDMHEDLGEDAFPERATAALSPMGLSLEIEPVAYGPLVLRSNDGRVSRFPRAMARYRVPGGAQGWGWIEWNQPQGA
jgi:hypothetical protein